MWEACTKVCPLDTLWKRCQIMKGIELGCQVLSCKTYDQTIRLLWLHAAKPHNADIFRPDLAILCDFKKCPHGFFCLSHLRFIQTLPEESNTFTDQLKVVSVQDYQLIATYCNYLAFVVPTATPLWSWFFRGDLLYTTDRHCIWETSFRSLLWLFSEP